MSKFKLLSLFTYYAVLLYAIIVMDNMEAPSIILRVAYLLLFSLPILFICPQHFPAMLIAYMSVGTNHFAFTYFPYDVNYYPVLVALGIVFIKQKHIKARPPLFLVLFSVLVFFVDFFIDYQVVHAFYGFLTLLLLLCYLNEYDNSQKEFFANLLCVMGIAISYIYLSNYKEFLTIYVGVDSGVERGGWSDPNYLACTIGMGVMAALIQLLTNVGAKLYLRVFWITSIIVSIIAMVLIASRGALLSVSVGAIIFIIHSNTSKWVKVGFIVSMVVFVICLLNSSYIELLQYRLETESGDGGNGRFAIWEFKLSAFLTQGNFMNFLFGYGYKGALYLGHRGYWAIHNDFVALLCDYGVVGLCMFSYMFYYPIKSSSPENRVTVITLLLYLVICCCSLEPFSAGRLPFYGFYLFIFYIAKSQMLNLPNRV